MERQTTKATARFTYERPKCDAPHNAMQGKVTPLEIHPPEVLRRFKRVEDRLDIVGRFEESTGNSTVTSAV